MVTMSRSAPECRPIERPISWMVETKSSAKPPRVSEPLEGCMSNPQSGSWGDWKPAYVGRPLGERGPGSVRLQTMQGAGKEK